MRVVITGTSGRIGSAIASAARAAHRVTGVDWVPGPRTDTLGDLRDPAVAARLCRDTDAVIHAAALHAPHVGVVADEHFIQVNVEATRLLLEACRRFGVTRFVFTSTTSVYGHALVDPQRAVWVTEDLVPRPRDVYDKTKLAGFVAAHRQSCPGNARGIFLTGKTR